MNEDTADMIIELIAIKLARNEVDKVVINWFGGEPMLHVKYSPAKILPGLQFVIAKLSMVHMMKAVTVQVLLALLQAD